MASRPEFLGFGAGLREHHAAQILADHPPLDWLEIISENYMMTGGARLRLLERLREHYPIVMHGVSLSIASIGELDESYLLALKALADRLQPRWVSDHLCWTGVHGRNLHDLLPVPYTQEALDHIAGRVDRAQDILGRPLVLENVSAYVRFRRSEMTEWEFIGELARRTGCWLLLDISNLHINAFNHGFDPHIFLDGLPADRVAQFHLAGYRDCGTYLVDTHDQPVSTEVWALYAAALRRFGPVSTMVEQDDDSASLGELVAEVERSRIIADGVLGKAFR
ncbi:DUF692 domain-containing protein [Labrys sp. LIt4]|nr:DUF692 domain-containing protein [Labrys sp. LIt4]